MNEGRGRLGRHQDLPLLRLLRICGAAFRTLWSCQLDSDWFSVSTMSYSMLVLHGSVPDMHKVGTFAALVLMWHRTHKATAGQLRSALPQ